MNQPSLSVALICDYALSYLGGAQTALVQQAAALAQAGARVVIVSPSDDETWRRVQPHAAPGVEHISIGARWTLPGLGLPVLINNPQLRERLKLIFEERAVDIVHLHSEFGLAAAAIAVAVDQPLSRRIPVLHTVHTFFWQAPPIGQPLVARLVRRFHRWATGLEPTRVRLADRKADSALRNMTLVVAQKADLVISPSAHQADRLQEAGLDRVAVVPNTVNLPDAAPITGIDGPIKIIWIGRLVPEKRILTFVAAAVRATGRLPENAISFTVVGDGQQRAEAQRLASDTSSITFLGRQDHDRIAGLLADSHLLALTSRGFDNQPMTVVEAVMAMRGVLYCDPALSEGLDGPGIASPASEEALSDVFVDLVRHPDRVIEASQAAESARQVFSPGRHADSVLELYRSAISRVNRVA